MTLMAANADRSSVDIAALTAYSAPDMADHLHFAVSAPLVGGSSGLPCCEEVAIFDSVVTAVDSIGLPHTHDLYFAEACAFHDRLHAIRTTGECQWLVDRITQLNQLAIAFVIGLVIGQFRRDKIKRDPVVRPEFRQSSQSFGDDVFVQEKSDTLPDEKRAFVPSEAGAE